MPFTVPNGADVFYRHLAAGALPIRVGRR